MAKRKKHPRSERGHPLISATCTPDGHQFNFLLLFSGMAKNFALPFIHFARSFRIWWKFWLLKRRLQYPENNQSSFLISVYEAIEPYIVTLLIKDVQGKLKQDVGKLFRVWFSLCVQHGRCKFLFIQKYRVLQGSKLTLANSQNASDFDDLRVRKISTSKRLLVRIINVSQTKGNNLLVVSPVC